MRAAAAAAALLVLAAVPRAAAQTAADSAAIRATVEDYIQGWYDADSARMARSLHPSLAKRIVNTDRATGRSEVEHLDAATLTEDTRTKTRAAPDQRRQDLTILDVYGAAASVKLVAQSWVDYMHLGKVDGRWVVVNVLWEEIQPQRQVRK